MKLIALVLVGGLTGCAGSVHELAKVFADPGVQKSLNQISESRNRQVYVQPRPPVTTCEVNYMNQLICVTR
jgi:hypothetical protein